jgi:outer membrane biosynthesis protein TonB
MVFGQSVFQSVLTRLKNENEEEPEEAGAESFRILGLGAGFVASTADEAAMMGTGTEAYFAFMHDGTEPTPAAEKREFRQPPEPPQPAKPAKPTLAAAPPRPEPVPEAKPAPQPLPQPVPAHLLRLTREQIAEDLAITPQDTEATLADKRRRFAKQNHPDRVAPQYRDKANLRMQTANLLIDLAIKRLAFR